MARSFRSRELISHTKLSHVFQSYQNLTHPSHVDVVKQWLCHMILLVDLHLFPKIHLIYLFERIDSMW